MRQLDGFEVGCPRCGGAWTVLLDPTQPEPAWRRAGEVVLQCRCPMQGGLTLFEVVARMARKLAMMFTPDVDRLDPESHSGKILMRFLLRSRQKRIRKPFGWLKRVVYFTLIDELRSLSRNALGDAVPLLETDAMPEAMEPQGMRNDPRTRLVVQGLGELNDDRRFAVESKANGLSAPDAAKARGCSPDKIRQDRSRGIRQIREYVLKRDPGGRNPQK